MQDVSTIDWKQPYSEVKESDPSKIAKQKVFFEQNGIDYSVQGKAINVKQVKAFFEAQAADAQKVVDAATLANEVAQANIDEMLKGVGGSEKKSK